MSQINLIREKYCGNSNVLPDGYTRFGTRYECLKTGYGAALYNASDDEIARARARPKLLTTAEINQLAGRFNINTEGKTRREILNNILTALTTALSSE